MCWAIGEHGGGGESHKDAARELFESLELLLYENLSSRYIFVADIAFFILRDLLHGFFCGMLTYIFSFYHLFGSRLGLMESTLSSGSSASRKSLQSRLLCFVITAIAKLATHHRDLLPRARVSLAKVSLVILHNHLIQKLF